MYAEEVAMGKRRSPRIPDVYRLTAGPRNPSSVERYEGCRDGASRWQRSYNQVPGLTHIL